MEVSQDRDGKWVGYLRKQGDSGLMYAVTRAGELTETKLAVCREAETLGIVSGQSLVDLCIESLAAWREISY